MTAALCTLGLGYEHDVVLARQRARQIAALLGFEAQDQTRIATAVSEIARNAYAYAGGGTVGFSVEGTLPPQVLLIQISDRGRGIERLDEVLAGRYRSATGMGIGLSGARRLMDQFDVKTSASGTVVTLAKLLPARAPLVGAAEIAALADALVRQAPQNPVEEIQRQNQELLRALEELNRRQEELQALNRELEDTNRGVVALYAELDEKADHLRRADDLKSRFLSNMSHEFRTPVSSIQALARMLLDRTDGALTAEQERQVAFIRKAADTLAELVNDLLDLAKVEAGKIEVRVADFEVGTLFGTLRGMLRPLLVNESVALVFDEPEGIPPLRTDEAKVSQILRNFISNALKFTERGEVRVSARVSADRSAVEFSVADTGIGIAAEDRDRIFHEFTQIDSPLQRKVKGTGLGLPLCRKLAELLGGSVRVESEFGLGSTFTAVIPMWYGPAAATPSWELDPGRQPVLVVEDSPEAVLLYEKYLLGSPYQMLAARSVREARDALVQLRPRAIVLDILLPDAQGWELLAELKRLEDTRAIPVVIISTVDERRKGMALGADAYCVKPVDRDGLLEILARVVPPPRVTRVLVVDDEEISRYVLRQHLPAPQHAVSEAATGSEVVRRAQLERPDVICLDLLMPDLDGFRVLQQLRADPATRGIAVVVVTSKHLEDDERQRLRALATTVLPKGAVSRDSVLSALRVASQLVQAEAGR